MITYVIMYLYEGKSKYWSEKIDWSWAVEIQQMLEYTVGWPSWIEVIE